MPFCANCGSAVEGQFCTRCGSPMGAPSGPASGPSMPVTGAPATTGMTDNVAGALSYLLGLITGVLFLALAPYNQSKFVRFHAFQSIFLSVAWFAVWIVESIVAGIVLRIMPFMFWLIGLLWLVIGLGFMVIWILLMVKAYQNQKWVLPVIGPLAEKQA